MSGHRVGSIVKCRGREWVVLPPAADPNLILLRPLAGADRETCGIYLPLANLGLDRVEPAEFPLPRLTDAADAIGAELLWNATRLTLRDGAGPLRSLGRISFRPRAYQFVPLLMALRLDPIRLLIADDVGIGKTIEASLIARELLDRGEVRRLCVLCPPYLCDWWQGELAEKFHIDAVVIRAGTVRQLERDLPSGDHSVFGYYPHIIVSIDYAKADRRRANFIQHCPDLVIVDEAHGAARPAAHVRAQQQRHDLLCEVARNPDRHLILVTATPHSGIEAAFVSLLGLLKPNFGNLDFYRVTDKQRDELARHFVQRRRADVKRWLDEETPFPDRVSIEETYDLSAAYKDLFKNVYEFSRDLVQTGETLTGWKQRIRFWSALALLRCVMSSPAAAEAAVLERLDRSAERAAEPEADDESYAAYIYEPTDEAVTDAPPAHIVQEAEQDIGASERTRLRAFARMARELAENDQDQKVRRCAEVIARLLEENHHPIVWCRYISTSDYVASQLQRRLERSFPDLRVVSITGAIPEEERQAKVKELEGCSRRVLVATDCLSEGINLQAHFTAVLHYDLPWNPNRLEQREGRVDRFGQRLKEVKAFLLYGRDNPVDGAVLDVLLRKAKDIHRTLGVSVPVPMDSETVMEAVLKALFRQVPGAQLALFEQPVVRDVHQRWEQVAAREKESRTRFAQRALNPEAVKRELEETDAVLGDPGAVQRFVLNACQRLNVSLREEGPQLWSLSGLQNFPEVVRNEVPEGERGWRVTFSSPPPEGATYLGRNHPFVAALAQYLLESALVQGGQAPAARCGVIKTRQVARRTSLLLLRLRCLLEEPDRPPLLAEQVMVTGLRGMPPTSLEWLGLGEALDLLQDAKPEANVSPGERHDVLAEVISWWPELQESLAERFEQEARRVEEAHRRVRASAHLPRRGLSVRPQLPADLLGMLVLVPIPMGVRE